MLKYFIATLVVVAVAGKVAILPETCSEEELLKASSKSECSDTFVQCANGKPVTKQCPSGLKYNQDLGVCDWESNVAACTKETEETCSEEELLKASSKTECTDTFVQCVNGKPVTKQCSAGLKFNQNLGVCDWESNVAACAKETEGTPATPSEDCKHEELVKESDCSNKYYHCVHGELVPRECPADLVFDGVRCEWRRNVKACNAPVPSPEQTAISCEHDTMALNCEDGAIEIVSASYGRSDLITCNDPRIKTTDCHAESSENVMRKECGDKSTCTVEAENTVFGDPCRGTYKYLTVTYKCQKDSLESISEKAKAGR